MYNRAAIDCELCAETAGLPSRFRSIYSGLLSSRVLAQTPNFLVIPSLGQLGDAHLMVVSRGHETATANLAADKRMEMLRLIGDVQDFLLREFGDQYIIFENGDPQGRGDMACSVSHMHVHFVGFRKAVPILGEKIRGLGAVPMRGGLRALAGIGSAYSYMELPTDEGLLVSRRLPSQTLRRMIAIAVGNQAWDWAEARIEKQLIEVAAWRISAASRREHVPTP